MDFQYAQNVRSFHFINIDEYCILEAVPVQMLILYNFIHALHLGAFFPRKGFKQNFW